LVELGEVGEVGEGWVRMGEAAHLGGCRNTQPLAARWAKGGDDFYIARGGNCAELLVTFGGAGREWVLGFEEKDEGYAGIEEVNRLFHLRAMTMEGLCLTWFSVVA
jgi:hypothetical protein